MGAAGVALVSAAVVLAPEVTLTAAVTVTVEEGTALVVADSGAVAAVEATTVAVETTAVTTATIATSVGTTATYVGYAAGVANIGNSCSGGRTPECVSAIEEFGMSLGFGAVEKLVDSPAYEFLNALREFENAVGESEPPC